MRARIQLGDIDAYVIRKDIKNVHLSVHPPLGRVRIAVPQHMSLEAVRVFAIAKVPWIKKQQRKLQEQERETPREYIDRESHYVWGKRHLLKVVKGDRPAILVRSTLFTPCRRFLADGAVFYLECMTMAKKPMPANRDETGKFLKGHSGNPNGRPKDIFGLAQFARENSFESLQKLVEMMQNKQGALPPNIVLAAIAQLLDRGMGKPMQPTTMQHLDENGQPTKPVFAVNVSGYDEPKPAPAPKTKRPTRKERAKHGMDREHCAEHLP